MGRRTITLLFSLFLALSPLAAQMPYAGAPCPGANLEKPTRAQAATFASFDAALRSAMKRQDSAALAFLIRFPLRVNTAKGTLLIPDAFSLDGHFEEIFPAVTRQDIIATTSEDLTCRYDEGVGYKNGVLWISLDDHGFAVDAVNSPALHEARTEPQLLYTCTTSTHRIAINQLSEGKYRYRSWRIPKEISESPDLELSNGTHHFEGTGVCSHEVLTFNNGRAIYEVGAGLGCTEGSEPAKATGDLSVTVNGKKVTQVWCF